ncbi:MAG: ATP-binding protein, partial [Patescibacteria group bacterium]
IVFCAIDIFSSDRSMPITSLSPDFRAIRFDSRPAPHPTSYILPEGGTISIRKEHRGKFVEVSVKDTGYGIPVADLPRLFQKLSRGGNAAKYKPKGTGMGLFLAKNVVEKAGGTIALESKEGKGTTVRFTLPLTNKA